MSPSCLKIKKEQAGYKIIIDNNTGGSYITAVVGRPDIRILAGLCPYKNKFVYKSNTCPIKNE